MSKDLAVTCPYLYVLPNRVALSVLARLANGCQPKDRTHLHRDVVAETKGGERCCCKGMFM